MNISFARLFTNLSWLIAFSIIVVVGAFLSFVSGVVFDDSYQISIRGMPEAGGVLPSQEVTVYGHAVGIVEDVNIVQDGVEIVARITEGQQVPSSDFARVVILRRSPIGEQTVDIQPISAPWTAAEPGEVITVTPDRLRVPTPVPDLLARANDLFGAIDPTNLGIVVSELADAFGGRGQTLRQLNRNALDLNRTLVAGIPELERSITASEDVLEALRDSADALGDSFAAAADLGDTLTAIRPEAETLLFEGQRALVQADALIRTERANLTCLIDDFNSINAMLTGPSTAPPANPYTYASKLDELEQGLQRSRFFFAAFDAATQWDPEAGNIWARILVDTQNQPTGRQYRDDEGNLELRATPATRPGAACQSEFGRGVQAIGAPGALQDRNDPSTYQPPDSLAPPIDWAPVVASGGGQQFDPPPTSPLPTTGGGMFLIAPALLGAAVALRRKP